MFRWLFTVLLVGTSGLAMAKPIAFANGTTAMLEYGAGTMQEVQVFYAPVYWASFGAGYLHQEAEQDRFRRDISYVRGNLLLKRWNLPSAQANIFAYGGIGGAHGSDFSGTRTAFNGGLQADYETRRIYLSAKTDLQTAPGTFSNRTDTVQIGIAPYEHDWDVLATWFVFQARNYTGGLYDDLETALLLRMFKGPVWFEAGLTQNGAVQSMLMFNF